MTARSSAGRTAASSAVHELGRAVGCVARPGPVSVPHRDRPQPRQRVDDEAAARHEARVDRRQVGEVVASQERRDSSTRCSTPATRSWAASSGGRRNVLSGTRVAPARLAPIATTGHDGAVRHEQPTRVPLPTPLAAKRHATSAALRVPTAPYVSVSSSVTTNGLSGCSSAHRRTSCGTVEALARSSNCSSIRRRSGLPLESIGRSRGREHEEAARHLVRRQPRAQSRHGRRRGRARSSGSARTTAPTTWPRSASGMPEHEHREAAGDLTQRGLDLARRHVRARGLDHVAAPAVEVVEAVVVDAEQIAGAVPLVGGEDLEALPPVVALHQRPARGTTARRWSPIGTSSSVSGSTTRVIEAGDRDTRTSPRRRSGWSRFVGAHQAHAAGLGHPEHVVAQLRIGRTDPLRAQRVEVAGTDRREVACGEASGARPATRSTRRSRWSARAVRVR